jgi:hypothetical protein
MRGIATMPAPRRPRALTDFDEPVRVVRADRDVEPLLVAAAAVAAGSCAPVAGAVPQTSQ